MKKILYTLLLMVIVISCKTVSISKVTQRIASSPIELGVIGELKPHLELNNFNQVSFPRLQQKIRIEKKVLPFSKATYNAYKKACKLQGKKNSIKYVDSLPDKPQYVSLNLADKQLMVETLKKEENNAVLELLKYSTKLKLVTSLTISLEDKLLQQLEQADAIFLVNTSYKKYEIELLKKDQVFAKINFSDGVVFAYELSSFCWNKQQYTNELMELKGEKEKCKEEPKKKRKTTIKF